MSEPGSNYEVSKMRTFDSRLTAFLIMTLLAAPVSHAHPGAAIAVSKDGIVYIVDTGAGVFSMQADESHAGRGPRSTGSRSIRTAGFETPSGLLCRMPSFAPPASIQPLSSPVISQ